MEIFRKWTDALAACPAWVPLIALPAALVVAAILFTLLGGRRAYPYLAAALGAAGFALMCCVGELAEAFVYLGTFSALAALLRLLFFLPRPRRRKGEAKKRSRAERIYERFRGEPLVPTLSAPSSPAKVCCFEEEAGEEAPPELSHAVALLEKLRKQPLSAADRLEADVLTRSVAALKGRALTEAERDTLNDCLASVLKLTAKYKV